MKRKDEMMSAKQFVDLMIEDDEQDEMEMEIEDEREQGCGGAHELNHQ
jgi:hypothetical protein